MYHDGPDRDRNATGSRRYRRPAAPAQPCAGRSPDRPTDLICAQQRTDALRQIVPVLKGLDGGAIVYCQTRKKCEELGEQLQANGIDARVYHAGLSAKTRNEVQMDFVYERLQVVVATVAFGMGIDV